MQIKQAFTLVELIVVITILAILGTIAFISFQGYSKEARDTKRQTDIRSLINKINILQAEGTQLSDLISPYSTGTVVKENTLKINDQTKIGYQGKINFENLGENESNFVDPKSGHDYPFAYSKDTIENDGKEEAYNFMQLAYVSEKDGRTKLVGNYYEFNPTVDTPSLFTKEGTTGTNGNSDFITDNDNNQVYDIGVTAPPKTCPTGQYLDEGECKVIVCNEGEQLIGNNCEDIICEAGETLVGNECILNECGETNDGYTNADYYPKGKDETAIIPGGSNGWQNEEENNACFYKCKEGFKGNDCSLEVSVLDCESEGEILISGSRYGEGEKKCSDNDRIVCTGSGTGYTIAACNVGAIYAGTHELCVTEQNSEKSVSEYCSPENIGYHFQWGNNYGFSSLVSVYDYGVNTTVVDTTSYGPNNYYNSGSFSMMGTNWTSSNNNLWGGESDNITDKRGPCESGYHIPTNIEWRGMVTAGYNGGTWGVGYSMEESSGKIRWTSDEERDIVREKLLLPLAGLRAGDTGELIVQGKIGRYWSSIAHNESNGKYFIFYSNDINPGSNYGKSSALSIRCFKD